MSSKQTKMMKCALFTMSLLTCGLLLGSAAGAPPLPAATTLHSLVARADAKTYRVRLEAYSSGTLVESTEITFVASDELAARNEIGNAEAAFARSLNNRNKPWNRITHVLLSVNAVSTETASLANEFSYTATCTIKCQGNVCKQVCEAGTVFAIDAADAKFKAEAKLRQEASREGGSIVEGTVTVTVTIKF